MQTNGDPLIPERSPEIASRSVTLRPVERDDYRVLFDWRSDLAEVHLWTTSARRVATFEQFIPECDRWLAESITLLVVTRQGKQVIGFSRAYNLNIIDGWAWVQSYMTPTSRLQPYVVGEVAALFARYLFSAFPLRKLYAEVFEYNTAGQTFLERIGFVEAARLSDHVWWGNQYWGSYIYALTRDDWIQSFRRYAAIFSVEREVEMQVQVGKVQADSDDEGGKIPS